MPSATFRADQRFMYMIPRYPSRLLGYINVRFGSQADLKADITPTAASGGKAASENAGFAREALSVRFHQ